MRKRTILIIFFLVISVSTILGFAVASKFWGHSPIDLTMKSNLAGIVTFNFEKWPNTQVAENDVVTVMKDLVPQALDVLSRRLADELNARRDQTSDVKALEIEWQNGSLTIKLDAVDDHRSIDVPFPVIDEWFDIEEGLVLHDLIIAITFADNNVASACFLFRLVPFQDKNALPDLEPATRYLWDQGLFQVKRDNQVIVDAKLETIGSNQSLGITLWRLPDTLRQLSMCVGQHLDHFTKEGLSAAFSTLASKELLDYISLGLLRSCKLEDCVYNNCGVVHLPWINSHALNSSSIPLNASGLCYSVFGL